MIYDISKIHGLYITGLGRQYPSSQIRQDQFEGVVERLVGANITSAGIQKLIAVNRNSEISSRATISDWSSCTNDSLSPPPIDELSRTFRHVGVDLTVKACKEALVEAGIAASDITHTVAVTCTDTSNPGYDLNVAQELKIDHRVDRALLHGVGCAGGLSALRLAANQAAGASQRRRPARILVFACELCSLFTHRELQDACENSAQVRIGSALFSDAAAAVVVCNELALHDGVQPIFELLDWSNMTLPGTSAYMGWDVDPKGYKLNLTKEVPKHTVNAIAPMFEELRHSYEHRDDQGNVMEVEASDCDWAMHPGGAAILRRAQRALNLSSDHLRASLEIYRSHGNSSSPTVLIVLDQLRKMGVGRDNVVATSFGPGLSIEMFTMRRCR